MYYIELYEYDHKFYQRFTHLFHTNADRPTYSGMYSKERVNLSTEVR